MEKMSMASTIRPPIISCRILRRASLGSCKACILSIDLFAAVYTRKRVRFIWGAQAEKSNYLDQGEKGAHRNTQTVAGDLGIPLVYR